MKEWIIRTDHQNERLDKYLRRLLPQAGGGFLYRMLRKKNITLNDKKAAGSERVREGDVVRVWFSDATFEKFSRNEAVDREFSMLKKQSVNLHILLEDEDILCVDKPAGMLSQRAGAEDVSLNEQIRSYLIQERGYSRDAFLKFRPAVMNRLDFGTSGIVLAAKTLVGARTTSEWIRSHQLVKEYVCLVHGHFVSEGRMISYLKKNETENMVSLTEESTPGSKRVETIFSRRKDYGRFSLLEASLITGKSHQIRAQLAAAGTPIVFDAKYGDSRADRRLREVLAGTEGASYPGQLLHAHRLVLPDGRKVSSPIPSVFEQAGGRS